MVQVRVTRSQAKAQSAYRVDYKLHETVLGFGAAGIKTHRNMWQAKIVRVKSGKVVWSSPMYGDKRAPCLRAGKVRLNYEAFLIAHGIGYEEEQERKREAERAEVRFRKVLHAHKEAMYAALRDFEIEAVRGADSADLRARVTAILSAIDEARDAAEATCAASKAMSDKVTA